MQVIHPNGVFNHLQPEDVFIAVDDMGTELGRGYTICQYQPNLYPDRPVNIYFTMECQPVAQYLLFGALVARARQLRDLFPGVMARAYTNVAPGDTRAKDFYLHNGFSIDDEENVLALSIPAGDGRIPMSCSVAPVALNTHEEVQAFVSRLHQNDLAYITPDYVQALQRQPHFLCMALYRTTEMIGEILMGGVGDSCELAAIYIKPEHRRQGMGRALLHRSLALMRVEGVRNVSTVIMTRSLPQVRLMDSFSSRVIATTAVYPYLYL